MFLFSKKSIFLLLLVSLLLGGERHSAQGELASCHKCKGKDATHGAPYCDENHKGDNLGTSCFGPDEACYVKKDSDGNISKDCEPNAAVWKGPDGNPKCIKNKECYCNEKDFCNKDKNFGLDGESDNDDFDDSFHDTKTIDMSTGKFICILVGIIVVLVVAYGPYDFTPTK